MSPIIISRQQVVVVESPFCRRDWCLEAKRMELRQQVLRR